MDIRTQRRYDDSGSGYVAAGGNDQQREPAGEGSRQQGPTERTQPQLGTGLAGGEGKRQGRNGLCRGIMPGRRPGRILWRLFSEPAGVEAPDPIQPLKDG